jgi:hypothetical protein
MTGLPSAALLEPLLELLFEILVLLWRALIGLLRLLFRFDIVVESFLEFWVWLRGERKPKRKSPSPDAK